MNDEQAIRSVIEQWMLATKAGDIGAILDLMTDDVVFLVAGKKPFGKEEFKKALGEMNGLAYEGVSNIEEIHIAGNMAFVRSFLKVATLREGSPVVRRSGYTLTIFQKCDDGKWRLSRDANLLAFEK
jgi:uncharacterized protein (TIGR02246 family)